MIYNKHRIKYINLQINLKIKVILYIFILETEEFMDIS